MDLGIGMGVLISASFIPILAAPEYMWRDSVLSSEAGSGNCFCFLFFLASHQWPLFLFSKALVTLLPYH